DFPGLNLTFEMREGIVKHSRDWDEREFPQLAEYLLQERPPLEAQLIDLTDEIAYNTADLDDGYEAELLKLREVRERVPVFDHFYREAEQRHPQAPEKLKFNGALKRMLDRLVTDLLETTRRRLTDANIASVEHVRSYGTRLAGFSDEADRDRSQAKTFLYERLYFSDALQPEKAEAE